MIEKYLDLDGLQYAFSKAKEGMKDAEDGILTVVGGYMNNRNTPFFVEDVSGEENVITIKKVSTNAPTIAVEASVDMVTWNSIGSTTVDGITITMRPFGRIYLRSDAGNWGAGTAMSTSNNISAAKVFNAGGDILSLLRNGVMTENCAFLGLFANSLIVDASRLVLPDNTTVRCYNFMFYGCTALTAIPNLPATILSERCYGNMFSRCTSLTHAPELPSMTMEPSCYAGMFFGCTSLTHASELPSGTLAVGCYNGMFNGCTSLTKAPALHALGLAPSCYAAMFLGCTSLQQAPVLPAKTLAPGCYGIMFSGCTNLIYIKALFSEIPDATSLDKWVQGVASNGVFIKSSNAVWDVVGESGIPENWVVAQSSGNDDGRILLNGDKDVSDWDLTVSYAGSKMTVGVAISIPAPGQMVMINGEMITYGGGAFNINIEQNKDTMVSFIFEGHVIPDHFYANNDTIEKIYIGRGAVAIGTQSFANCSNLEVDFSFADLLTEIGETAFYGAGCTTVKLPESVSTIREGAFAWCPNLHTFDFNGCVADLPNYVLYYCSSLTSLTLGNPTHLDGIKLISGTPLTRLIIPSSVSSIGRIAFAQCNLRDVIFKEGLSYIGNSAFLECNLDDVVLPSTLVHIGDNAFSGTSGGRGIGSLVIESKNLSYVGVGAFGYGRMTSVQFPRFSGTFTNTFANCKNLRAFTMIDADSKPTFVETFVGCENLQSIGTFNGSVFGKGVFKGCKSLRNIPSMYGMTEVPEHCFDGCEALEVAVLNTTITSIGDYAFNGCKNLSRVGGTTNVTRIGNYAFYKCARFSKMTDFRNVSVVGDYAFAYCGEISDQIKILANSGHVKVGDYAFYQSSLQNRTKVEQLWWKAENVELGVGALKGLRNLYGNSTLMPKLALSKGEVFTSTDVDDEGILLDCDRVLFDGLDSITLGQMPVWYQTADLVMRCYAKKSREFHLGRSALLQIGQYTLYDDADLFLDGQLNYILIHIDTLGATATMTRYPGSHTVTLERDGEGLDVKLMKHIADDTGANNQLYIYGLSLIVDGLPIRNFSPKTVKNVGTDYLVDLYTAAKIKTVNRYDNFYVYNNGSVNDNLIISSPISPLNLQYSTDNTTWHTVSLNQNNYEIYFPTGSIIYFRSDDRLAVDSRFVISSNNQNMRFIIGGDLRSVLNTEEIPTTALKTLIYQNAFISGVSQSLVLPATVPTGMFDYNTKINRIYFNDGVKEVAPYALRMCSLSNVYIPEGVTSIGNSAFTNSQIVSVVFPDTVTSMGTHIFSDCLHLEDVVIPAGITAISIRMFNRCSGLKKISIPQNIKTIGSDAFYSCTALEEVDLTPGLEIIGDDAFSDCSMLAKIDLPITVKTIGDYAFYNTKITTATLPSSVTTVGTFVFYRTPLVEVISNSDTPPSLGVNAFPDTLEHIYVPSGSVDAYKEASGWSRYADIISAT